MTTVGEKLQEARLDKGLTLEDVSRSTKIKVPFLEFIEAGEYSKLPSVSYAQGFVKNYTKFLGLSEKEMMAIFRREFDEEKAYRVLPKGFDSSQDFLISRVRVGQTVFLILLVLIIFFGYILFQYRYAFINPPLTITFPKDLSTVFSSEVKITGKTDSNSTVYVNKDAVSVDSNGNFEKTIIVFPGKNLIDVKAVNKFSKQSEKKIEVNVKSGS